MILLFLGNTFEAQHPHRSVSLRFPWFLRHLLNDCAGRPGWRQLNHVRRKNITNTLSLNLSLAKRIDIQLNVSTRLNRVETLVRQSDITCSSNFKLPPINYTWYCTACADAHSGNVNTLSPFVHTTEKYNDIPRFEPHPAPSNVT